MSSSPSGGKSRSASIRQKLLPYLTNFAHGSAPFITTFVLIHLTAPALASLGGSSLSSSTMLLGREYYQTDFGEKYLVLGPLAVHSLSGIVKRLISPPGAPPRPLSALLSWTGYASALFLLPIHFMTHRVDPATVSAPIFNVGPAELDFEFVKLGLQRWPLRSWFLYFGLVSCVALHAADGVAVIWNNWFRTALLLHTWGKRKRNKYRNIVTVFGVFVLPVFTGLYVISRETPLIFSSLARRYEAVFTNSLVYRI